MGVPMLMYGVALNEAIRRGNLSEMRELAAVSSYLMRTQASDLESDESKDWAEAHKQLVAAIAEKEAIQLAGEDIVAIRDSIVVIDNVAMARALKTLLSSDAEGLKVEVKVTWTSD